MNLLPQPWHYMQCSMHPVHAKGQQVVICHQSQSSLMQWSHHILSRIVAWNGIVQTHIEGKLPDQSESVMMKNCFQLFHVPTAQILLVQSMLLGGLCTILRECVVAIHPCCGNGKATKAAKLPKESTTNHHSTTKTRKYSRNLSFSGGYSMV